MIAPGLGTYPLLSALSPVLHRMAAARLSALAIFVASALVLPATAAGQGTLAFTSLRCDQGGVAWQGPGPGGPGEFCTRGIFAMGDDGSNLRRLTTGASPGQEHRSGDFSPSWSPAGDRIVFSRQTTESYGYWRLFTMAANGSDQRPLLDPPPDEFIGENTPVWSPTGNQIAFSVQRKDTPFAAALYVVRPDGGGLRRVSPEGWAAQSPAFTRDGLRIVFFGSRVTYTQGEPPGHSDYGVWMTTLDGSPPVRVTSGDVPVASNGLSFSPSGLHIAMTVAAGPEPQLYAMRTDGTEMRKIEDAVGVDPTWAGTGGSLFYINGDHAMSTVVTRLDLRPGAKPVALTNSGGGDASPEWSALGGVTSGLPTRDDLPPVTLLGEQLGVPPGGAPGAAPSPASISSAQQIGPGPPPGSRSGPQRSRIPFLVIDGSGIKRVEAGVGLRVKGGCRFLTSSRKLGQRRSCSRPTYVRVADSAGWTKQTSKLPRGKYEVRFRTTDRRGNVTKRPKRRVVTLK